MKRDVCILCGSRRITEYGFRRTCDVRRTCDACEMSWWSSDDESMLMSYRMPDDMWRYVPKGFLLIVKDEPL